MSSFGDSVESAGREMGGGSDWYKYKEGDNRMRILSEPTIQVSRFGYGICYEGAPYCQKEQLDKDLEEAQQKAKAAGNKDWAKVTIKMPSKKWCAWAIIRGNKDKGEADILAIVGLTYTVSKELKEMMGSDEAGFKGWPMPFDLNIKAKGAGLLTVEYQLIPNRANSEVTPEEMAEFEKKTPVDQILNRMKDKQRQKIGGTSAGAETESSGGAVDYPAEDINPDDIPF